MSKFDSLTVLQERSNLRLSYEKEIKDAFILGLWYNKIPANIDALEIAYTYEALNNEAFISSFISETSDGWHEFYRSWRELGWERVQVKRDGGLLKYLMRITDSEKPEGFESLEIRLDITLSTCKRVSKGFETQQVEVFETVCEDLIEPEDE